MSNSIVIEWPKRESWTVAEAACLLADVEPVADESSFAALRGSNPDVALVYRELKDATLMGSIQFVDPGGHFMNRRVAPTICVAWAKAKGIGLPTRIVELESRLPITERFQFDSDSPLYPPELDIALIAWRTVTRWIETGSDLAERPPKELLDKWLNAYHKDLPQAARDRIATVANWQKSGGRPRG